MAKKDEEPAFDHKLFMAMFEKQFGKEAVVDLKEQPAKGAPGTFVPTPSEALNLALGIGGIPLGRVIEIYGPESSGKSTLASELIASCQRMFPKKKVAYIDVENAVNREYLEAQGVDVSSSRFLFTQEGSTENALNMMNSIVKSGGFSIVVLDSVNALRSNAEIEEQDVTHGKFGGNSKPMSSALRHIQDYAASTGTIPLFLNQIREKMNVQFGSPETTSGGRALAFYASVRIRTQIKEQVMGKDGNPVGARVEAFIKKNKVAPPLRKAQYDIIYGVGIDKVADLVDVATDEGLLAKNGAWYSIDGKNVAQGRDKMKQYLIENPNLQTALRDTLWSRA